MDGGRIGGIDARLGESPTLLALTRALEGSPTPAAIVSRDAIVEFANEAFAQLAGCAREQLVCANLGGMRRVLDAEAYDARVTLAAGFSWRGEVMHVRRDGRRSWVSTNISPLPSDSGETTHYLVLSEDVTRYRAPKAATPTSLLPDEAAPTCTLLVGLDGTILFLSGSMTGLASANLVGQDLLELTLEGERARVRAHLDQVIRTGESVLLEVEGMAAEETKARYVTRISPIMKDGEVVALTLIALDRTNAQRSLSPDNGGLLVEEARVRLFAEASLEAIVLHGNGKVIDANNAFAELFGYERLDVIGMPVQSFLTQESHADALERAASGIEGRYHVRGLRRDASTFPIEIYVRNLANGDEHLHAAVIRETTQQSIPAATPGEGRLSEECEALSPRELEVLELLAMGLTNRQVAKKLRVSSRTVDHHVSHVLTKLNVPNRTAAVFVAEQAGVLAAGGR